MAHPGNIEDRGGSWRIRLCVASQRHYFTVQGTREEAEQYARERDTELRRRNGRGLPGHMPFSELLAQFEDVRIPLKAPNTRKTYRHSLDAFRVYFVQQGGDPQAHEVRPGHVQGFLHWRRTHGPDGTVRNPTAARTQAKDRAVLHSVFALGEELEVIQGNPVRTVKVPKGDTREPVILDGDQYEALLKACNGRPMLWLYVLVLGETGLRCESEGLWLRWQDVDLEGGFLTVETVRKGLRTKSGKSRKVPMTRRLSEAFREHMASYRLCTYKGARTPWVFHHLVTRRTAVAGERIRSLRAAFGAAAERANLPEDLVQHDLRHRRVTTWLAAGKSPAKVQKAMGHSDIQTTMRYTHLVSEDLLDLVDEPTREELKEIVR